MHTLEHAEMWPLSPCWEGEGEKWLPCSVDGDASSAVCVMSEFKWKTCLLADGLVTSIPQSQNAFSLFTPLSHPHTTTLCLPASLYSIPYPPFIPLSQPKLQCVRPVSSFSAHTFKVRSSFFSFFLSSSPRCAEVAIWYQPTEYVSPQIDIVHDTFKTSRQHSVTVGTCVKIMNFKNYPRMPPCGFSFLSCSPYQIHQGRKYRIFL